VLGRANSFGVGFARAPRATLSAVRWSRRVRRGCHLLSRALATLVAMVLAVASAAGCTYLVPSRPMSPAYVVNRAGHYFGGSRCASALVQVGVFPGLPIPDPVPGTLDAASWRAAADPPGVAEIELYAAGQAGVTVVSDSGQRPYSSVIAVLMRDATDHWVSVALTLEALGEDQVVSQAGLSSWGQYMKMSARNFAC